MVILGSIMGLATLPRPGAEGMIRILQAVQLVRNRRFEKKRIENLRGKPWGLAVLCRYISRCVGVSRHASGLLSHS